MDFWPRHKFLIQKQFLFIFSILIIVIFLSCDDSYNSNSDEIDNNLKNFYWTLQAGTSSNDIVNDIGLDQSGNIYLTGYTQGSLSSTANNGGKDVFLIKYDTNGSLVWKNQIGTSSNDEGSGLVLDNDSNIIVAGLTYSGLDGNSHSGSSDLFVLKYNENGTKLWSQQLGTNKIDYATDVDINSSGNSIIIGATNRGLDSNSNAGDNKSDYFISVYNKNGAKQSTNQYGVLKNDIGYGIALDNAGNTYITGSSENSIDGETHSGKKDIFLIKFDSSINKEWSKLIGTSNDDEGFCLDTDSLGNVYVTGYTTGDFDGNTRFGSGNDQDVFLIKYDENGNKLWSRQFGTQSEDKAFGIIIDSNDNVYVTGKTCSGLNSNKHLGECDYFLIKYNSSGSNQWSQQGGSSLLDQALSISSDSSNNIYIAGFTYGSLDGKSNLGGIDYFVVKFDQNGFKQ